jgi:hydrogenase expression/formation protein HypE
MRVFPFAEADNRDVTLGTAFGEDVALTRVGEDILVSHVGLIVGAIGSIGWLADHVACDDIATSGIPARGCPSHPSSPASPRRSSSTH